MPRYRLLAPHVIDGAVREAGYETELDAEPSLQMEALDKDGEEALTRYRTRLDALELVEHPNAGLSSHIDRLWLAQLLRVRAEHAGQDAKPKEEARPTHAHADAARNGPPTRREDHER
jgi:hypothetical protein